MAASTTNRAFRRFYAQTFSRHIVTAMVVGMVILLATGLLDTLFQPERAARIWQSRLLVLVPLLALTLISARGSLGRFQQPVVLLFTLFGVGALLEFARLSVPPYHHYYNTGLVLMVMFCFVLTRLQFHWALLCTALLFLLGNAFWWNDERETLDLVVIKNFILATTCLFSLLAAWAMEQTTRRQFQTQRQLEHERDELVRLQQAERDQAWLRQQLDDYQRRISGEQTVGSLFRTTMDFVGETLAPGHAAAYYWRDDRLIGLAARGLPRQALTELAPGEGLAGEAARGTEMLVLDDLPRDYPDIRSGTGASPPRQLLLAPVRHQQSARGVLELALLEPATEQQRHLLTELCERLARALLVAEAREGDRHVNA